MKRTVKCAHSDDISKCAPCYEAFTGDPSTPHSESLDRILDTLITNCHNLQVHSATSDYTLREIDKAKNDITKLFERQEAECRKDEVVRVLQIQEHLPAITFKHLKDRITALEAKKEKLS